MTRPRTRPAVCIALAAALVYALMWVGYAQDWHWQQRMDWSLLDGARDAAVNHPFWVRFWADVSFALGPVPLRVLGAVAALAALVMRRVRAALLLLACAPLSGLVTVAAKALADRPRPSTMLVAAAETSFPSGHALEVTAALCAGLSLALPAMSRLPRRVAVSAVALSVLAAGASRVALNVHYPSDVLAGWSLGYLYFLLCVMVIRPAGAERSRNRWDADDLVTAR
ncbi:phosphatase PAP2 family protein [Mycobacterium paraseoulense]|uniref:Phosphatase PAP2 family protein n=1 Tax=Mycobacterium paraseoulense TaxID=590652 RepID=A0A1X0I2G6_9MYCO|nr:phosphatase PAP2 family protein [Mycobacterium paraseoulense]MCV7397686.1 phosphatase PAP2 family protein [Mycobacterium paraseoulense]ORB33144.1 phosphatase PAP2 family protein [Mycobacterium paraseoulense]BBZ73122.1 membrane protein [Mycobacterium paraseoulense]